MLQVIAIIRLLVLFILIESSSFVGSDQGGPSQEVARRGFTNLNEWRRDRELSHRGNLSLIRSHLKHTLDWHIDNILTTSNIFRKYLAESCFSVGLENKYFWSITLFNWLRLYSEHFS